MAITESQIIGFAPASIKMASTVAKYFNEFNEHYQVNTPLRIAAFLSQTAHESASFRYTREIASGDAYEGRKSLGNIFPGDGKKFKGRGYIQITGRNNYTALSKSLFGDERLAKDPEIIATPQYAMISAFWFWNGNNLNKYADEQYIETITKRINGGLNGFQERVNFYNKLCTEFSLPLYKIAS